MCCQSQRERSIWVARLFPIFLLGVIGYVSWVVTKTLCLDRLLGPSSKAFATPQTGPAVVILTLYYLFLSLGLICYARVVYVVSRCPGLVPRGSLWYKEQGRRRHDGKMGKEVPRLDTESSLDGHTAEAAITKTFAVDADVEVQNFWKQEVFTCDPEGRPAFCSSCYNWKPDRTHHCKELDRCVLKMDHFCPWVGGVVGEASFKFFVQFLFWVALFMTHTLVSVAYYLARIRKTEGTFNVNWAVVIGICGLLLVFSGVMCGRSLQFVCVNSTMIESMGFSKTPYLAIHVSSRVIQKLEEGVKSQLKLVTYPQPTAEQSQRPADAGTAASQEVIDSTTEKAGTKSVLRPRTFMILKTPPGINPFDLGFKKNFCDVMGRNLYEWLFPIHSSPCARHTSSDSFYKMGHVVSHLKLEAGISDKIEGEQNFPERKRRRRRERRRSSSTGHTRITQGPLVHIPSPVETVTDVP